MVEYPEDFPLDALALVTRAVKSGDLSDVDGLAHAAWNVQGFAMAHLLGPGAAAAPGAGAPAHAPRKVTRAQAIEQLDEFVRTQEAAPKGGAAPAAAALPIPWGVLLNIAIDLFRDVAARRISGG